MYRFLLRPLWILSHLFVIGVVVLMVNLGFWQLRRLDERRTANAEVTSAMALPAEPLSALVPAGVAATHADVEAVKFSHVLRGYKTSEVDWVLDHLAAELDQLRAENAALRDQHRSPEHSQYW